MKNKLPLAPSPGGAPPALGSRRRVQQLAGSAARQWLGDQPRNANDPLTPTNVTGLASPLHQQSPGAGRVHQANLKLGKGFGAEGGGRAGDLGHGGSLGTQGCLELQGQQNCQYPPPLPLPGCSWGTGCCYSCASFWMVAWDQMPCPGAGLILLSKVPLRSGGPPPTQGVASFYVVEGCLS